MSGLKCAELKMNKEIENWISLNQIIKNKIKQLKNIICDLKDNELRKHYQEELNKYETEISKMKKIYNNKSKILTNIIKEAKTLNKSLDQLIFNSLEKILEEKVDEKYFEIEDWIKDNELLINDWSKKTGMVFDEIMSILKIIKNEKDLTSLNNKSVELKEKINEIKKREKDLQSNYINLKYWIESRKVLFDKWEKSSKCNLKEIECEIEKKLKNKDTEKIRSIDEALKNDYENIFKLENKFSEREIILQGLKDVCNDMGYIFEKQTNCTLPEDDIKLIYNTLTEGLIEFTLKLDNVTAKSDISKKEIVTEDNTTKKACEIEFDKISNKLKELVGFNSKFKIVEEDDDPDKVNKTAEELPEDVEEDYFENEAYN